MTENREARIAATPGLLERITPGPWRIETDTTLVWGHCSPDDQSDRGMGYPIADARTYAQSSWAKGQPDHDTGDANAELIALAPTIAADLLAAQDEIARLREALEKLARLGNGDHFGNSDGNMIARAALAETEETKP